MSNSTKENILDLCFRESKQTLSSRFFFPQKISGIPKFEKCYHESTLFIHRLYKHKIKINC